MDRFRKPDIDPSLIKVVFLGVCNLFRLAQRVATRACHDVAVIASP